MKKYILSISVAIIFIAYLVVGKKQLEATKSQVSDSSNTPIITSAGSETTNPNTNPTPSPSPTPTTKPSPTPTPTPTPSPSGQYKDGVYTGSEANAFYGTVQVQATVSGGKLTKVATLKFPNDRGHSLEISNSSLPQLEQEAVTAQSANVDVISGATQTSEGFKESLAAALSQAKS